MGKSKCGELGKCSFSVIYQQKAASRSLDLVFPGKEDRAEELADGLVQLLRAQTAEEDEASLQVEPV